MKPLAKRLVLGAIAVLLFLAGCSRVATEEGQIRVLADGEALRKDAAEYAKDQNVSLDEAIRRLELQDDIGKLDGDLTSGEPDTFGGLWIQHKPEFKVVVNMTGGTERVANYARGTSLAGLVEVRKAAKTLKQLQAEQKQAYSAVRTLGLLSESGINVFKNQAELYVLSEEKLNSALATARGVILPKGIAIIESGGFSSSGAPAARGGAPLSSCTAGYSVRDTHGLRGITTAGHCAPKPDPGEQYLGAYHLRLIGQWYGGSQDVQWHTNSSLEFRPEAHDDVNSNWGEFRKIYDNGNRNNQAVGSYVCKFGKVTYYTCGYIRDKNIKPPYIPNSTATYVRLDNGSKVLTKRGDSGGPVYFGHQAWGTTYGGYFEPGTTFYGDHIYMAINYLTDVGLIVLHAPR